MSKDGVVEAPPPLMVDRFARLTRPLLWVPLLIGVSVAAAWWFDAVAALLWGSWWVMQVDTALCLVALSLGLAVIGGRPPVTRVLVSIAAALSGTAVVLHALGVERGLPLWLAGGSERATMMSPQTAVSLLGLSLAVLGRRVREVAGAAVSVVALTLLVVGVGYLFRAASLAGADATVRMSVHTLAGIGCLWLVAIGEVPNPFTLALTSAHGGLYARRLLPAAILVPIAASALALRAVQAKLVTVEVAWAVSAAVIVGTIALAVLLVAARLNELDAKLREAAHKAQEASEAKTRFLANMSHEIRTPMNAVIGMTGLLHRTDLTAHQRHLVDVVRNSGEQLLGVINDVLDFSRIEAEGLTLELVPVRVASVVQRAVELVAFLAPQRAVEVDYFVCSDVPGCVLTDATRWTQILVNLASNSVKFTEEGEVTIRMERGATLDDGRVELLTTIRDTGIGIPADRLEVVFDAFVQADASTTRDYGGTGLGLAITRRIVDAMGGVISVQSELGVGTTFTIRVPVQPLPDTEMPRRGSLEGLRLLVVDDVSTNRELLTQLLQGWSVEPVVASSGAEALALVEQAPLVDGVLLDQDMPGMDGMELARQLRALHAELKMVMLSSGGRVHSELLAATMMKPIRPSTLLDTLATVFGRSVAPSPEGGEVPVELGGARLLVVEDTPVNQQVALLSLEAFGLSADVASDGMEALQLVQQVGYDLIFMDMQMPRMDGLQATRQIRALPGLRQPRIVAMTANVGTQDRQACLEAGMDSFLAKPFVLAELRDELRAFEASWSGREPRAPAPPESQPASEPADGLQGAVEDGLLDREAFERTRRMYDRSKKRRFADGVRLSLETLASGLEAALTAADQGDVEALAAAAHKMKSTAGQFGAAALRDQIVAVETAAREGTLDRAGVEALPALVDRWRAFAEPFAEGP